MFVEFNISIYYDIFNKNKILSLGLKLLFLLINRHCISLTSFFFMFFKKNYDSACWLDTNIYREKIEEFSNFYSQSHRNLWVKSSNYG